MLHDHFELFWVSFFCLLKINFCMDSMLALPQPSTRSLQHIYQTQLGRFFQDVDFMPEVKDCLFPLVSAAVSIYYKMNSTMRPTPSKIHYTFNIRDLSQVRKLSQIICRDCLLSIVNNFTQSSSVLLLICGKCERYFRIEASNHWQSHVILDVQVVYVLE